MLKIPTSYLDEGFLLYGFARVLHEAAVALELGCDLEVLDRILEVARLKFGFSRSIAFSFDSIAEIAFNLLSGFSVGFIPNAGILLRIFSSSSCVAVDTSFAGRTTTVRSSNRLESSSLLHFSADFVCL